MTDLTALRRCFREPIAELLEAARLLDAAVAAHSAKRDDLAKELIGLANMPVIRQWTNSIWGAKSPYVHFRTTPISRAPLPKEQRAPLRMPDLETRLRLHRRDGFHCRCCGIPVIRTQVRERFRKLYPDIAIWGIGNSNQHAAFQALWVQYDHIYPHALGGTNDFENLVVTCAACNFGRMHFTFEEVGLLQPLSQTPTASLWDGLERLLPASPFRRS